MSVPPGFQAADTSRSRLPVGNALAAPMLRTVLIVGLGVVGVYLCLRLAAPFFTPLAAAFILSVLFAPAHRWISAHVKHPGAAAFILVLLIAGLVLAILVFLTAQLVQEAAAGAVVVRAAFGRPNSPLTMAA